MRRLLVVIGLFVAAPAAAGTITGVVTFKGEAPAREKLRRDSDPYCDKTEAFSDEVIVTKGKLADVVVRLVGDFVVQPASPRPAVVTQTQCSYTPRVQIARPGQQLAVRNLDATYHNVHAWLSGKTLWNDSHPAKAEDIVKDSVGEHGDVLELKCDVHPWMHAYVVVVEHAMVDVTGTDGAFRIDNVGPGTYVVEAWHPTLGTRTTKVTVKGKKTVKAKLAFEPVAEERD